MTPDRMNSACHQPCLLLQLPECGVIRALAAAATARHVKDTAPLKVEVVLHENDESLTV
ncbi:hypothetical protein OG714_44565 [Streptomyces sp. NBC_00989]|nr:hypothetical protein OG714_44565 [Streptomyces sp. NBC_00989]